MSEAARRRSGTEPATIHNRPQPAGGGTPMTERTATCPACAGTVRLLRERHGWRIALHFTPGTEERCPGTHAWPEQEHSITGGSGACSCPSGDGSLRWPCPVHPPATAVDRPASTSGRAGAGQQRGED